MFRDLWEHYHDTVIDNLFDGRYGGKELLTFGTMLVDAGVRATEIKNAAEYIEGKDKAIVAKLIHMANSKAKLVQRQRSKRTPKNSDHVRE